MRILYLDVFCWFGLIFILKKFLVLIINFFVLSLKLWFVWVIYLFFLVLESGFMMICFWRFLFVGNGMMIVCLLFVVLILDLVVESLVWWIVFVKVIIFVFLLIVKLICVGLVVLWFIVIVFGEMRGGGNLVSLLLVRVVWLRRVYYFK